jgi:hypothetical protein
MKDLWLVSSTEEGGRTYVSTANPEKSNWLRYLRPAPVRRQRNVGAVVKDGGMLYFVTMKNLAQSEELLYWMDDPELIWTKKRADKTSITILFFNNVPGFKSYWSKPLGGITASSPIPRCGSCTTNAHYHRAFFADAGGASTFHT